MKGFIFTKKETIRVEVARQRERWQAMKGLLTEGERKK